MALKYDHTILFVDDEISIPRALKRLFRKEDYTILTAPSGPEALTLLQRAEKPVSLIISDQQMPEMTGAEFLERAKEIFPDAIRFLLTGFSDMDAIVEAVNKGEIHRYLTKPWNDRDLLLQVQYSLEQYELVLENRRLLALTTKQNKNLNELNKDLEEKVAKRTQRIQEKNNELAEVNAKLEKSLFDSIRLLASLVTTLNPAMGKYMSHTARLSRKVAEEYGLGKKDLDNIEMAAMIHDIGLLGLPERIMEKDAKDMGQDEFKMFSYHPVLASTCLEPVENLWVVNEIILYHHEYCDGSGFPNGLKGSEIPLGSRIIGPVSDYCRIVDTWPKDIKRIINKSKGLLGDETDKITFEDPEKVLDQVAQKIILFGAQKKYDSQVVTHLIKKLGYGEKTAQSNNSKERSVRWVNFRNLQEGMVLMNDLRLKDGRLLLVNGTPLKKKAIDTIRKFGGRQLINEQVCISD